MIKMPPQLYTSLIAQAATQRVLVAIAGPPGAGKSTVSEAWCNQLNQDDPGCCAVVPMDGFHLDNETLDAMGLRSRKGAPETFDANGFIALLKQIKSADRPVRYPTFDRNLDASIPDSGELSGDTRIVLVEGNYLLLDSAPWNQMDYQSSILIHPGMDELKRRLVQRWLDQGMSHAQALEKAEGNDLPNARTVLNHSRAAHWVFEG